MMGQALFSSAGMRLAWLAVWAAAVSIAVTAHAEAGPLEPVQQYELADFVVSLDISPDGALIAIGGSQMVRVVDADTIAYLHTFRLLGSTVRQVYFSPDGAVLMALLQSHAGTLDGLRFWRMDTGEQVELLPTGLEAILSAAWSPDGQRIVTGHGDGIARTWSLDTGSLLQTFEGHEAAVNGVAFSPDGTQILTGSSDATARLWDAESGDIVLEYDGHSGGLSAVAFTPDGIRAITVGFNESIHVWRVEDGEPITEGASWDGRVGRVVASPDGTQAFTNGGIYDGFGYLFELENATGSILGLDGFNIAYWPTAGVFGPEGDTVVTASLYTHRIDWWEATSGEHLRTVGGHPAYFLVEQLRYAPDGKRVASAGRVDHERWAGSFSFNQRDPTVRLWDTASSKPLGTLYDHEIDFPLALFTQEGWHVLQSFADRSIHFLDATTGEEMRRIEGLSNLATAIAWSPDGEQLVLALSNGVLQFRDFETHQIIGIVNTDSMSRMVYTPDGSEIITNEWNFGGGPAVTVRSPQTGLVVREIGEGMGASPVLQFTPDGNHLLTVSGSTATLWDWKTGEVVRSFSEHAGPIGAAAISPNGRYLATGTSRHFFDRRRQDRDLQVWDINTGEEVRRYSVYPITAITFSPDGERITAAQDTNLTPAIHEWNIADFNPYLVGDVNNDGVIDAIDVQFVINAALGLEIPPGLNPDRNFSGSVGAVDVQLVINDALGITPDA